MARAAIPGAVTLPRSRNIVDSRPGTGQWPTSAEISTAAGAARIDGGAAGRGSGGAAGTLLEAVFLDLGGQGTSVHAEVVGGARRIAVGVLQRLLDELTFEVGHAVLE